MGFIDELKRTKNNTINSIKYIRTVNGAASKELSALLLCHALEKGMGIQNVKKGYGKEKTENLISILLKMAEDKKTDNYTFKECLAILKAYFDYQESTGVDVSELKAKAEPLLSGYSTEYNGGYKIIEKDELMTGTKIDFEHFVMSRHSMRTYSDEPVSKEEFLKAVSLAKRAPSACNREPWKVYYSLDKKKCRQIASAVPPQSFLDGIPYFCVVTTDKSLFKAGEINQWFVNGGIFLGYLGMALHSCGIGSCIFQFPIFSDTASKLRSDMAIPKNEEIIAVMGYGKFAEKAKCICADRRPDEDIAICR